MILSGHAGFIITLNRIEVRQSLAIVPWHPLHGTGGQFPGVALQLDQVVEGVHATQLAGVDQAHEQIADLRPVQGVVKHGVPAPPQVARSFLFQAQMSPYLASPVGSASCVGIMQ